jgi:hypothetical protein
MYMKIPGFPRLKGVWPVQTAADAGMQDVQRLLLQLLTEKQHLLYVLSQALKLRLLLQKLWEWTQGQQNLSVPKIPATAVTGLKINIIIQA